MRRTIGFVTTALVASLLLPPAVAGAEPLPDRPVQVPASALESLADSAGLSAPVLLEGDAPGLGDAGQVMAVAWPSAQVQAAMQPGAAFTTLPVARGQLDAQGHYQLRLDLRSLPAGYLGKAGALDLVVTAWDGRQVGEATTTVRFSNSRKRFVGGGFGEARVLLAKSGSPALATPSLDLTRVSTQVSATSGVLAKAWVECKETLVQRWKNVWATVGEGLPAKGQQASFTFKKSQTVTLGVAVRTSKMASYAASGTITRTGTFEQEFAKSGTKRYFQVQVEEAQYKKDCYAVTGGNKSFLNTEYVWRPLRLTGGTQAVTTTYTPKWTHCVPVAAGKWTREKSDGSAYSNSVGLDASGVVGIDLSVGSQYDTSNALVYHQTKKYQVCGNNDAPLYASRIAGKAA